MLRLTPLKIFAAAAVLSAVGAFAGASRAEGDPTLEEVAGYRGWTLLNPEPIKVEPARVALA
jgi:hypothetical protein